MRHTAIIALFASTFIATGADAFPVAKATPLGVPSSATAEKVNYGYYRHCYWRHGYRYCHRSHAYRPYYGYGYAPYYAYDYGPSFAIVVGRGHHHHHHW